MTTAVSFEQFVESGRELRPACDVVVSPAGARCGDVAEWAIWVSHGSRCQAEEGFVCEFHKIDAMQSWVEILQTGDRCVCGYRYPGPQLSDNLRVIKL